MGGKVSASTMSKSMDLTDKISRSTLPLVSSRGVSPKRTTMSSAANTLSRSIDLVDKIYRLVSSSMSSQGGSPKKSPSSNGADDVSRKVGVRKDLKLSSLAISSRRVSPITTAASDGTRTLSESMDLTEKDNSTLSSSVSSPSISPSASLSSVSNAASQTTTKSSEILIGPWHVDSPIAQESLSLSMGSSSY
ncbi:secreted protein CSS1-like [Miscanthus floridulus]|uniref:secreted protein CSS1-like n=1 Tax=Miscanthus floridulus TaxID=154761 RepID=UPI00345B1B21